MIYSICQREIALLLHNRGRTVCTRTQKMHQDTGQYFHVQQWKSVEDYDPIKARPLKTPTIQEERFQSVHQKKNPDRACPRVGEHGVDSGRRKWSTSTMASWSVTEMKAVAAMHSFIINMLIYINKIPIFTFCFLSYSVWGALVSHNFVT